MPKDQGGQSILVGKLSKKQLHDTVNFFSQFGEDIMIRDLDMKQLQFALYHTQKEYDKLLKRVHNAQAALELI